MCLLLMQFSKYYNTHNRNVEIIRMLKIRVKPQDREKKLIQA